MRDGSKACPFCGSRFTFETFELVDSMPADQPCDGCERLYTILAESARLKAEMKPQQQTAEVQDLSPSSILARLLGNRRRQEPEAFDARMAAAEGRD
jgi:hypothetical protein